MYQPDYYYASSHVLNNAAVQTRLKEMFGKPALVQHITDNAILLIDYILEKMIYKNLEVQLRNTANILRELRENRHA